MGRALAVVAATVTSVLGLAGLAGCTTTVPGASPSTTSGPHPLNVLLPDSSTKAKVMLNSIVLPPGSHRVPVLTQKGLRQPEQRPACHPLIDRSRFWTVRGTVGQVQSFLSSHPAKGTTTSAGGSFTGPTDSGAFVVDVPVGQPSGDPPTIVVTFIGIGNGDVGIRADAEIVPSGARCVSSGGGPATSASGATSSGGAASSSSGAAAP